MRKFYFIALAFIVAAMTGCQEKDEFMDLNNGSINTFYATFENGAGTRSALDENNNVIWSDGDLISIFEGTNTNKQFKLADGEGTSNGKFNYNNVSTDAVKTFTIVKTAIGSVYRNIA